MERLDILDGRISIFTGDALAVLSKMKSDSVDCVVTSPPYWGLRDYGVEGQIGLEPTLGEHIEVMVEVFRAVRRVLKPTGTVWLNYGDCYATAPNGRSAADTKAGGTDDRTFRDKPFSTVGPIYDPAYAKTLRGKFTTPVGQTQVEHAGRVVAGGHLKPKDLCMIPNRLAIALQDDGWWIRSEIIWGKNNPMPDSSGAFRPSTAHEKIFMLTKSGGADVWRARDTGEISSNPDLSEKCPLVTKPHEIANRWIRVGYHFDADAVRKGDTLDPAGSKYPDGWDTGEGAHGSAHRKGREKGKARDKQSGHSRRHAGFNERWTEGQSRKYEGTQNGGGTAPPHRGLQGARDRYKSERKRGTTPRHEGNVGNEFLDQVGRGQGRYLRNYEPAPLTVWPIATRPFSEAHFATFPPELAERCILAGCPKGGLVLDPFGGAGTTALVAARYGRLGHLIELNSEYVDIARRRIENEWRIQPRDDRPPEGPLFEALA